MAAQGDYPRWPAFGSRRANPATSVTPTLRVDVHAFAAADQVVTIGLGDILEGDRG